MSANTDPLKNVTSLLMKLAGQWQDVLDKQESIEDFLNEKLDDLLDYISDETKLKAILTEVLGTVKDKIEDPELEIQVKESLSVFSEYLKAQFGIDLNQQFELPTDPGLVECLEIVKVHVPVNRPALRDLLTTLQAFDEELEVLNNPIFLSELVLTIGAFVQEVKDASPFLKPMLESVEHHFITARETVLKSPVGKQHTNPVDLLVNMDLETLVLLAKAFIPEKLASCHDLVDKLVETFQDLFPTGGEESDSEASEEMNLGAKLDKDLLSTLWETLHAALLEVRDTYGEKVEPFANVIEIQFEKFKEQFAFDLGIDFKDQEITDTLSNLTLDEIMGVVKGYVAQNVPALSDAAENLHIVASAVSESAMSFNLVDNPGTTQASTTTETPASTSEPELQDQNHEEQTQEANQTDNTEPTGEKPPEDQIEELIELLMERFTPGLIPFKQDAEALLVRLESVFEMESITSWIENELQTLSNKLLATPQTIASILVEIVDALKEVMVQALKSCDAILELLFDFFDLAVRVINSIRTLELFSKGPVVDLIKSMTFRDDDNPMDIFSIPALAAALPYSVGSRLVDKIKESA